MTAPRIFDYTPPGGEPPVDVAAHLKAGGTVQAHGHTFVATDPDSIRIDPRDNFVICDHGHSGNGINACEREAAPDQEFCGNHGGLDFDPLDVFGADPDDWRKYQRRGL